MPEFIFLFLFRAISGAQNGFGYALAKGWRIATSILLITASAGLASYFLFAGLPLLAKLLAALLAIVAALGILGVEDSFNSDLDLLPRDIHLWESIATGAITAAWAVGGGNLLLIAASIYPALLLHKGFVNLGAGLPFWSVRTDDATGRTFRIPLLGLVIVRGGNAWRIFLAAFSLAMAGATIFFGWHVTLVPPVIDLFGKAAAL